MSNHQLKDKVALVTGASSGLGEHFAEILAGQGAKVIVAARRTERLSALVEKIQTKGGKAIAVAMDVSDSDSVCNAISLGEEAFGAVTVLVNNAGVGDSRRVINVDEKSWDFVMETNLKGAWRVAH